MPSNYAKLYQRTVLALAAVGVLSLPMPAMFYAILSQEKGVSDQLAKNRETDAATEELLNQLLNLETGVRGYTATKDKKFLEPYWVAKQQIPVLLARIKAIQPGLKVTVSSLLIICESIVSEPTNLKLRQQKTLMDSAREQLQEIKKMTRNDRSYYLAVRSEREQSNLILATMAVVAMGLLLFLIHQSAGSMKSAFNLAHIALEKEEAALLEERKLSEAKNSIIQTISHEYRTPLAIISTACALLENDEILPDKKAQYLDQIHLGVRRLNSLVNEVLEVFKLDSQGVLSPETIQLLPWLKSLVESFEDNERVLLDVQVEEFCCDEALLHKIMANLLSNALKYSHRREAVFIWIKPTSEGIQIRIKDRGIGIPHSVRLYQPFERGSNVGAIAGTGLGLAIVKKAVELMGGKITVHSAENEGCEFVVTLPNVYTK